jgi:hypothetical protein
MATNAAALRKRFLFVFALALLPACAPKVERYFERTELPQHAVPLYGEAGAFQPKATADGGAAARRRELCLGVQSRELHDHEARSAEFWRTHSLGTDALSGALARFRTDRAVSARQRAQ